MDIDQLVQKIIKELQLHTVPVKRILFLIEEDHQELKNLISELKKQTWPSLQFFVITTADLEEYLQNARCFEGVYTTKDKAGFCELLSHSTIVSLPFASLSTIAKASLGISDTPGEVLFSQALAAGKKVLLNMEYCLPDSNLNKINQAYLNMVVGYLTSLVRCGCQLTCTKNFIATLFEQVNEENQKSGKIQEFYMEKSVITEKDIELQEQSTRIFLSPTSTLTIDAKKIAADKNIEIWQKVV